MKPNLFLLIPITLVATTINIVPQEAPTQSAPIQQGEVIRTERSQRTYNRPSTPSYPKNQNSPPHSYRSNTSQDAWHNSPNNENYYDDPNWPNVKR